MRFKRDRKLKDYRSHRVARLVGEMQGKQASGLFIIDEVIGVLWAHPAKLHTHIRRCFDFLQV